MSAFVVTEEVIRKMMGSANAVTTIERDAIQNPQAGQMVFNTTTGALEVYNGTSWSDVGGGGGGGGDVFKVYTKKITLNQAQILQLHDYNHYVEIVPSPGANKMLAPISVWAVKRTQTVFGNGNNSNLLILYTNQGQEIMSSAKFGGGTTQLYPLIPKHIVSGTSVVPENFPTLFTNDSISVGLSAQVTGGHPNARLDIYIVYEIIDLT